MPLAQTETFCSKQVDQLHCQLRIRAAQESVQLPLLYYPHLLKITVNGQEWPYAPIQYGSYVLTRIVLPVGPQEVKAQFVGLSVANWISRISFILFIFVVLFYFLRKRS